LQLQATKSCKSKRIKKNIRKSAKTTLLTNSQFTNWLKSASEMTYIVPGGALNSTHSTGYKTTITSCSLIYPDRICTMGNFNLQWLELSVWRVHITSCTKVLQPLRSQNSPFRFDSKLTSPFKQASVISDMALAQRPIA